MILRWFFGAFRRKKADSGCCRLLNHKNVSGLVAIRVIHIAVAWLQLRQRACPCTAIVGGGVAILVGDGVAVDRGDAQFGEADISCRRAAYSIVAWNDGDFDVAGGHALQRGQAFFVHPYLVHLSKSNIIQGTLPLVALKAGKAQVL